MKRNIITIAVGKKLYIDMAVNLYHSFINWNSLNDIEFHIVTDNPQLITTFGSHKLNIIAINPGELGTGFSSKLHLDKLAPEGQTLFIDSDCLIFGDLNFVFNRFKGRAVSVIGTYINKGDWFGDIAHICNQFNIPNLPKFNGGIYYLEKGETANKVYELARSLEKKYDEIGFKRLRGKPNDEVLMALALALNKQEPILEDATIMSDPQACPGKYKIDLIKGFTELINPLKPNAKHQEWYPFHIINPVIFHFLGYYTNYYPYQREVKRLNYHLKSELSVRREIQIYIQIELVNKLSVFFKDLLRPIYHLFFGFRKIKTSDRV
jgi:hypothetical protein